MKAIDFEQRNMMLAENQPEYETLPVYCEVREVIDDSVPFDPMFPIPTKQIPWEMTACFELTDEEIEEIIATKKVWHTQCLFGNSFQPIRMTTKNPFQ